MTNNIKNTLDICSFFNKVLINLIKEAQNQNDIKISSIKPLLEAQTQNENIRITFEEKIHLALQNSNTNNNHSYITIDSLRDKKLINTIADIYFLKEEDIQSLKKDGKKFAKNLIDAIEKSKENDLDKLICALGIRHIGTKSAKMLAKRFKSIDGLISASFEDFVLTEDIGEIIAQSIYEFFKQEQTIKTLQQHGAK